MCLSGYTQDCTSHYREGLVWGLLVFDTSSQEKLHPWDLSGIGNTLNEECSLCEPIIHARAPECRNDVIAQTSQVQILAESRGQIGLALRRERMSTAPSSECLRSSLRKMPLASVRNPNWPRKLWNWCKIGASKMIGCKMWTNSLTWTLKYFAHTVNHDNIQEVIMHAAYQYITPNFEANNIRESRN